MIQFLLDLNNNFVNIKGLILSSEKLPSLGRAYSLVHQEEKQKSDKRKIDSFAFQASTKVNVQAQRRSKSNRIGEIQDGVIRYNRTRKKLNTYFLL